MEDTNQKHKSLMWIQKISKENYLRVIYMVSLEKPDGVHYADLEKHFGFAKASVCQAMKTLKDGGCITMDSSCTICLTEQGRAIAEKTYEKYCFFRDLLVSAGVEQAIAEEEADMLEHGISAGSLHSLLSIDTGFISKVNIGTESAS